jgi:uncharacterized membrane protein YheB (UPF0754 family)
LKKEFESKEESPINIPKKKGYTMAQKMAVLGELNVLKDLVKSKGLDTMVLDKKLPKDQYDDRILSLTNKEEVGNMIVDLMAAYFPSLTGIPLKEAKSLKNKAINRLVKAGFVRNIVGFGLEVGEGF